MAITVATLYELSLAIDSEENKDKSESQFQTILTGVKSGPSEKRLTAQLIERYFVKFATLQDRALDSVFELCEDDDVEIRKIAIGYLPKLCKQSGPHVAKIADVLVQLLQSDHPMENAAVGNALFSLLESHTKDTLNTIFSHIINAEEDILRERAVKFVANRFRLLSADKVTPETENFIIEESRKVLQDVTGDEFILFVNLLSQLSQMQTVSGRQQLLDIVVEQADLDKPFDPSDPDRVDQITQCAKQALPFLSKNVHSTAFTSYLLNKVLPVVDSVSPSTAVDGTSTEPALDLMRICTDFLDHCGVIEDQEKLLDITVKRIKDYLPTPPSQDTSSSNENITATDDQNIAEKCDVKFSELEALIWALHKLARFNTNYMTSTGREEEVKELRKRFQYLARLIQLYSQKLKDSLTGKTKVDLLKDENKLKVIALRTTSNLQKLICDFLHRPPQFKCRIHPSWRVENDAVTSSAGIKRPVTSSDKAPAAKVRKDRAVYQPPSGKFSEKAGNFPGGNEDDGTSVIGGGGWQQRRGGRGGGGFRRGNRGGRFRRGWGRRY